MRSRKNPPERSGQERKPTHISSGSGFVLGHSKARYKAFECCIREAPRKFESSLELSKGQSSKQTHLEHCELPILFRYRSYSPICHQLLMKFFVSTILCLKPKTHNNNNNNHNSPFGRMRSLFVMSHFCLWCARLLARHFWGRD